MTISPGDINSIVKALQESDWDEATVVVGDVKISVARNGMHPTLPLAPVGPAVAAVEPPALSSVVPAAPATAAPALASPAATPVAPVPQSVSSAETDVVVTSPTVGVFWSAPEPGAPPFVEIGSTVAENDVVCIVEIMKLMSHVPAGTSGVITAIHATVGDAVQFGSPLFSIRPDAG
jgi:acetyl-CoA carboxylase biotin carboxyl carrier protein